MDEERQPQTVSNSPNKGIVLGSRANKGFSVPDDFNQSLDDLKDFQQQKPANKR
jgi:hypothetical protein